MTKINIKTNKAVIRGAVTNIPFELLTYSDVNQMATNINELIGDDLDFKVEGWCVAGDADPQPDLLF